MWYWRKQPLLHRWTPQWSQPYTVLGVHPDGFLRPWSSKCTLPCVLPISPHDGLVSFGATWHCRRVCLFFFYLHISSTVATNELFRQFQHMKKFRPITDIVLIVVIISLFCITLDTHSYTRHLLVAAMADSYGWVTVLRRSDTLNKRPKMRSTVHLYRLKSRSTTYGREKGRTIGNSQTFSYQDRRRGLK